VLERRATLGGGWQDRWDEFCLVTPNWTSAFPGFPFDGGEPDGFMLRDEIAGRLARYATAIGAPVVLEADVRRLRLRDGGEFELETSHGVVVARNVIVAAGSFHRPRIPPIASGLPQRLIQLHSHQYQNQAALPPGGVLVVGSGQSGVQLAEELSEAGREVFISCGSAGRIPRRYRGRDIFRWVVALVERGEQLGIGLPTVDALPDPRAKFGGNPACSGHNGGHDTNLREFASRGMTLLGRMERVSGERVELAPDLPRNLAWADAFFGERFQPLIDRYIELAAIDAPPDDRVALSFDPPVLDAIDLAAAGISTVLWTTGYALDYGWIELPIFDEFGYPRQRRGVTDVPGLYFVGLIWQHNQGSATLFGAGLEAAHVAGAMGLQPQAGTDLATEDRSSAV
jgi:putative flavoprotein involved in K+ transport